ncbi:MAG: VC0807 family protein, partial [Opitutales bacterium]
VSVLLTGGIGILEIPTKWFAIKEAAIPLLLGLAVLISLKTRYPLIRTLLYNPEMIETEKVQAQLERTQQQAQFDSLLSRCTVLLASSFFLSAGLNYLLARNIVVSPSGSDAFNTEVSKMMAWSWPIIAVPSMLIMVLTLILLIKGIKRMTGLDLEEVLKGSAGRT